MTLAIVLGQVLTAVTLFCRLSKREQYSSANTLSYIAEAIKNGLQNADN